MVCVKRVVEEHARTLTAELRDARQRINKLELMNQSLQHDLDQSRKASERGAEVLRALVSNSEREANEALIAIRSAVDAAHESEMNMLNLAADLEVFAHRRYLAVEQVRSICGCV